MDNALYHFKKSMFDVDRMIDELNRDGDAAPEQTLRRMRAAVDEYVKDAEQFDDLTMLCAEYKGTNQTA